MEGRSGHHDELRTRINGASRRCGRLHPAFPRVHSHDVLAPFTRLLIKLAFESACDYASVRHAGLSLSTQLREDLSDVVPEAHEVTPKMGFPAMSAPQEQ